MTAYAIQYRDSAWQLDPASWHPDYRVRRVLAVHRDKTRAEVEAIRARLPWSSDLEVIEWDSGSDAGVRAFDEAAR